MPKKVAIFWPGDYRAKPNEWALPQSRETTDQLVAALREARAIALRGRGLPDPPRRGDHQAGPDRRPDDRRLRPLDLRAAHRRRGRRQGQPAAAGVELLGDLARPGGPAQHGRLARERRPGGLAGLDRRRRLDGRRPLHGTARRVVHDRPDPTTRPTRSAAPAPISPEAVALAERVLDGIRQRRVLALMLGDTSMGMINGYFGPRLLYPIGFSEHKVDQAWLIDRMRSVADERVDDAFRFVQDRGVTFHWQEADAEDFTPAATREQLRGYLAVLDLLAEFQADCLGWQYQLGLLKLLPPSDFAEGLLELARPARGQRPGRDHQHRGRPGKPGADGADEAAPRGQGAARRRHVPRRALGRPPRRPVPLGPAQLGKLRRLRVQPRRQQPGRRPQLPPAGRLFPRARAARSPA